jgi:hypothetical protein
MARVLRRRIGVIPFVANTIQRLELPRNHVYKGLLLRLSATVTVAGGAADGVLNDEQPMSLLRDVKIVRNGSEILQSLDGGTLFRLAHFEWGTPPFSIPLAVPGVQAGTVVQADIPINFAAFGLSNHSLSLLRSVGTSSLFLEVAWGDTTSLIAGGDRTESFPVAPTIIVESVELMDLSGTYADKYVRVIDRQVTAASTRFEIDMERGPVYHRILLKSTQEKAGAAGVADMALSNVLINSVKAVIDGQLYLLDEVSFTGLRALNKLTYQAETLANGYAVIDFAEDGNPVGMIATAEATEFKLILDVITGLGITKVKAIPVSYTGARAAIVPSGA